MTTESDYQEPPFVLTDAMSGFCMCDDCRHRYFAGKPHAFVMGMMNLCMRELGERKFFDVERLTLDMQAVAGEQIAAARARVVAILQSETARKS